MLYSSVNFKPCQTVSVTDRGFAFGDGVFTTAKIFNCEVEYFPLHLARLQHGCKTLGIDNIDWLKVEAEMHTAAKAHNLGCLKVIITCGESERGYARATVIKPNVVVTVSRFPDHLTNAKQHGIELALSSHKLGISGMLAGLKHLNRLEQVMIKQDLNQMDADDVVVCDIYDNVVECSSSNIFWYLDGQWQTSIIDRAGVNGLYRQLLLNLCPDIKQVRLGVDKLNDAQAIFTCNAITGIIAVRKYLSKSMDVNLVNTFCHQLEPLLTQPQTILAQQGNTSKAEDQEGR
ncbi:aminodeoxychorismate lyase [Thalassotalea aquiviva]|uniref:aminodeoxychorismate lyase n=1 Tax=Thalassotalea aquiviva TaxID=3242415 RepID=UPI00352A2603